MKKFEDIKIGDSFRMLPGEDIHSTEVIFKITKKYTDHAWITVIQSTNEYYDVGMEYCVSNTFFNDFADNIEYIDTQLETL